MTVETPQALADYCRLKRDFAQQLELFDAYSEAVAIGPIDMATQLSLIAYVLSEIELMAPTHGLVVPALALLIDENVRALGLKNARRAGRN